MEELYAAPPPTLSIPQPSPTRCFSELLLLLQCFQILMSFLCHSSNLYASKNISSPPMEVVYICDREQIVWRLK